MTLLTRMYRLMICLLIIFTTAGVRQGYTLCSTLLNIYINDFPLYINENKNTDANLETKEINVFYLRTIVLIADTENDLQSLIDKAFQWSKDWCITFNPKKCNSIIHHRPKSVTVSDYKFSIGQTHFKTVNSCKYLGIIINDHLNFETCINNNNNII